MNDIYVILVGGVPITKDSAIRTYKTRAGAEKRLAWFRKYSHETVQIATLSVVDVETVKEESE